MNEKIVLAFRKNRIWLYPLKYVFIALILSVLTIFADMRIIDIGGIIPDIFLTTPDLAQTVLSTLSSSILAITTFTFSTTMVVLTMYSSQFSPRVVENFLSEKITLKVLGIFMGGFLYSVTTLLFMRKSGDGTLVIATTIGVIYAIVCLAYFAIFIFKVSSSIQAHNLIGRLFKEAKDSISKSVAAHGENVRLIGEKGFYSNLYTVKSDVNGYIQSIDYGKILESVDIDSTEVKMEVKIGDFIVKRKPILSIETNTAISQDIIDGFSEKVNEAIVTDVNRNISYDYMFAIKKIVDIALRAISPGINDPNTAIECIDILGVLLSMLSKYDGICVIENSDRKTRLLYDNFDFRANIYEIFYQIVIYAKSDISVVISILKALNNVNYYASVKNRIYVNEMKQYVYDKTIDGFSHPLDREKISELMQI